MRYFQIILERNILNVDEISEFSNQMVSRAHNSGVKQWLNVMLPAYIKKIYKRLQVVNDLRMYWRTGTEPKWAIDAVKNKDLFIAILDDQLREEVSEVIDYLERDTSNHNLSRLPFDVALKKSKEWHRQLANSVPDMFLDTEGLKLFKKYPDGYKWVLLTNAFCLDQEGNAMGHCVGRGSYDKRVQSGETRIFSLRDQKNESHVTIEITHDIVKQVKGKQNKSPIEKYRPYVIDLLNSLNVKPDKYDYDLKNMNIFYGDKGYGELFDVADEINDLPSGHKLVEVKKSNSDWYFYITKSDGFILLYYEVYFIPSETNLRFFEITNGVDTKSIRSDLIIALNKLLAMIKNKSVLLIDRFLNHDLKLKFGLTYDRVSETIIDAANIMKLVQKNSLYKSYINENKEFLVVDDANHPLIHVDLDNDNFQTTSTVHVQGQWTDAIPFMLEGLKKYKINVGAMLGKKLKLSGWYMHDHEWKKSKDVVEKFEPIFETIVGKWYKIKEKLVLYFNDQIMAALNTKSTDEPYIIDSVDKDYAKNCKIIKDDIADIFNNSIAEIDDRDYRDYRFDPFLMAYDVVSNGRDDFYPIDWDIPVKLKTEFINTKGNIVKTTIEEKTLTNCMTLVGVEDDAYSENNLALCILTYDTYEREEDVDDDSAINENVKEYYDDPIEYRKENKLRPKEKLPKIDKINYEVYVK